MFWVTSNPTRQYFGTVINVLNSARPICEGSIFERGTHISVTHLNFSSPLRMLLSSNLRVRTEGPEINWIISTPLVSGPRWACQLFLSLRTEGFETNILEVCCRLPKDRLRQLLRSLRCDSSILGTFQSNDGFFKAGFLSIRAATRSFLLQVSSCIHVCSLGEISELKPLRSSTILASKIIRSVGLAAVQPRRNYLIKVPHLLRYF